MDKDVNEHERPSDIILINEHERPSNITLIHINSSKWIANSKNG